MRQVLIIDDSDPDLLYSRLMVERARIAESVVTFGTAQEALDYLQRADAPPVDAILLDINMPETNGFAFLECFEVFRPERRHSAVVVMLTSSPDPHDRERAEFCERQGLHHQADRRRIRAQARRRDQRRLRLVAPVQQRIAPAAWLALGYAVLALVAIHLSRQSGSVATVWFANALGIAVLATASCARWPLLALAVAAGNLSANLLSGHTIGFALSFVPANLAEGSSARGCSLAAIGRSMSPTRRSRCCACSRSGRSCRSSSAPRWVPRRSSATVSAALRRCG